MSKYLARLLSAKFILVLGTVKLIISAFSKDFQKAGKAEDMLRSMVTGGTLFNSLVFIRPNRWP